MIPGSDTCISGQGRVYNLGLSFLSNQSKVGYRLKCLPEATTNYLTEKRFLKHQFELERFVALSSEALSPFNREMMMKQIF